MGKGLRHLILVLVVLLAAVCNMVNVTFCECSQGLVIGSCSCEKEVHYVVCTEVAHADDSVHLVPSVQHSHHCRHFMMNSDNWEFPVVLDMPQTQCTPCFLPVFRHDLGEDPLICLGLVREVYSPPECGGLFDAGGLGYCRPLLI